MKTYRVFSGDSSDKDRVIEAESIIVHRNVVDGWFHLQLLVDGKLVAEIGNVRGYEITPEVHE